MQTMIRASVVSLLLMCAMSKSSAIDREKFLDAVKEVETGGRLGAVGRNGERGPWQFTPGVWRQHSRLSFWRAHNYDDSRTVARLHFEWIKTRLEANGVEATPLTIAYAWNCGVAATVTNSVPRSTRDYASRVVNIYEAQTRHGETSND